MEYSSNYKKRQPPRRRAKRRKNPKKPLFIALAVFAVIALLVGGGLLIQQKKAASAASGGFEKVSESVSETAPLTETPTESPTEMIGDVSVTPCQMTVYSTTTTLNVRSIPSTEGDKLGMVGQDLPLSVTGKCANGWYRIITAALGMFRGST